MAQPQSSSSSSSLRSHNPLILGPVQFFVSVPLVMSWVFQAMRLIVSAETTRKFTVVSSKSNLAGEFGASVERADVPKEYGGTSDKSLDQLSIQ